MISESQRFDAPPLTRRRPKSELIPGEFNDNGSPKRKRPDPPKEKNKNGYALVIRLENVGSLPEECTSEKNLPGVRSLAFYSPRGTSGNNRKLLCGDDTGNLRLYHARNGTIAKTLDLGAPQSSNIAKTGASAAIGVGPDVVFLSASRADNIVQRCNGLAGTSVVSLAYDVLSPSYLVAGLDSGDVLVFNTKFRQPGESGKAARAMCKLVYKTPKSINGESPTDSILALKGYFVSSSRGSDIVNVWNSTNVRELGVRYVLGANAKNLGAKKGWSLVQSTGAGGKVSRESAFLVDQRSTIGSFLTHKYNSYETRFAHCRFKTCTWPSRQPLRPSSFTTISYLTTSIFLILRGCECP